MMADLRKLLVPDSRPKQLLDLYCAGGGAAMGYHEAGFEVTGVDINPQPHYPFDFIRDDVLSLDPSWIHDCFDAVHASPPCQRYTRKPNNWGRNRVNDILHQDLLAPTRALLLRTGLPFVIENVEGAPLQAALMLCGSMFGLAIRKHRYFEANWALPMPPADCHHHEGLYNPWEGPGRSAEKFRQAQGTPWLPSSGGASRRDGRTGDVSNAIPPAYTEWIGRHLMAALEVAA